jgi:hypothetical protein
VQFGGDSYNISCWRRRLEFRPEPILSGANVVVVPDNDTAGWGYAAKIVESLLPVVKSIRVLDLPHLSHKEDAFEWVNKYAQDRSTLAQIAKACPIVESTDQVQTPQRLIETPADPFLTHTNEPKEDQPNSRKKLLVESWDSIKDEPVEWLVESIIPKKHLLPCTHPLPHISHSSRLDLAEAIATGRDWMGYKYPRKGQSCT